jgi:hypothetical protein
MTFTHSFSVEVTQQKLTFFTKFGRVGMSNLSQLTTRAYQKVRASQLHQNDHLTPSFDVSPKKRARNKEETQKIFPRSDYKIDQ